MEGGGGGGGGGCDSNNSLVVCSLTVPASGEWLGESYLCTPTTPVLVDTQCRPFYNRDSAVLHNVTSLSSELHFI